MRLRTPATWIATLFALASPTAAQESASFRLDEHVLNLAGHPEQGIGPGSASHRISLDSLGGGIARGGLASASFRMDVSFGGAYPPPGEVQGLLFLDSTTLAWSPEPAAGSYNAYRGALSTVAGGGYGTCWMQDVPGHQVTDAAPVPAGSGFFYLVTANNRLHEEGAKGPDGDGVERGGNRCP